MFRALASGMSFNQGYYIVGSEEEEADAGERCSQKLSCMFHSDPGTTLEKHSRS